MDVSADHPDGANGPWVVQRALRLTGERSWARIGWAVLVAGAALLALFGATTTQLGTLRIASGVLMYVVLTQGWNVLGGYGGYLNFGMAMFFGIGAYSAAIISNKSGMSPLYTVVFAGGVAAIVAVVLGVPSLRLRGAYFAIVTFVLTLAVQQLASTIGITNGALGMYLKPPRLSARAGEELFFFIYFGLAIVLTIVVRAIGRSRFGSALVAIREDEDAAEVLGIATTRVKTTGFVIGAFVAGVVGCVYASQLYYIEPVSTFNFTLSLNVVVAAIVGGSGTWIGPVLGAGATEMLSQELLVHTQGVYGNLCLGALLVVFALAIPRGIVGLVRFKRGARPTL